MQKAPKLVSLFPYQIKDREQFYQNNHPKNLHPESVPYRKYWNDFIQKCVEGLWVKDKDTWIFMPPKLFFYINYTKISSDKERKIISPRLRDNEWIIFTYILCVDGFSGFELDEEYTCHEYIRRWELGQDPKLKDTFDEHLDEIEFKNIPESCKKQDGTFKKYVNAWDYLTKHYLIDNPTEKPLGEALYENQMYNGCILSARGIGKALRPDELVRVDSGWCKIKNLVIGDYVYGGDGRLTKVLAIHHHSNLSFYKVTTTDGREIDVCGDHLWKVWDKYATRIDGKRGDWVVKDTKMLAESYVNKRIDSKHKSKYGIIKHVSEYRYAIPLSESIKNNNNIELPLDPYVLGVMLGDGCLSQKSITFSSSDIEISKKISERLPAGFTVTKHKSKYGYNIKSNKDGFWKIFDELGLFGTKSDTKFIPEIYLYASEEQRLELLKGLMDTDGWSSKRGIIEFYTTSEQLAKDFVNLVRSLGIGCSKGVKKTYYKVNGIKIEGKDCHRIRLTTDKEVFTLKRKLRYTKHIKSNSGKSRYNKTFITSIVQTSPGPGVCITVDNKDKTYITKDYIRTHNSFTMFMGDFLHEFLFNGVRKVKDLNRVNDKLLFGMGASDGTYISKSIKNVSSFYDRMPGQYRYADPKKRKYMGPLYKLVQGTWKVGEETTHVVKFKNGRTFIDSSVVYISVLTKDKSKIGAGDRFRRVYIEEFGFLEEALEVHSANKDSLISEGIKVGSVFYTGTGGDLKKVKEPKKIFDNPRAYDIFGIPNYWENTSKKIGLFIPVHYAKAEYKDENGNTRLELIHKALLDQRKKNIEEMDSISYDTSISYNPMEPKEILRSNSGSLMPKREAQDQLSRLDTFDIFRKKAQIGSLVYKPSAQYGVDWEKDMENKLRPILDLDNEDTPGFSKEGAWIIFEQPPQFIPEGLYWVIYDPAKKSGDGESYHSILVYKSFYIGNEQTLYDTIVAEMICRKETLEENYQEVIKAARYFNAKIFPEINVAGFVEWCKDKKLWYLLEADAYNIEKEISPDAKRSYYRVGVDMNSKRKKQYAFRKLRDWLLDVKESDPLTGIPVIRTIDWIFSKRILNEMISFEEGENFDHISSLLCLMILLGKIQGWVPEIKEEEDYLPSPEEQYLELQKKYANAVMRQQRPAILQY